MAQHRGSFAVKGGTQLNCENNDARYLFL
jgi:hypothetical protein